MAFENPMVKYQINEVVFFTNQNSFLSGFKAKPISKFNNKLL
jgi:hypothetical protein